VCGSGHELVARNLIDFPGGLVDAQELLDREHEPDVRTRLSVIRMLDEWTERDRHTLALAEAVGVGSASDVVDVGCGSGAFLRSLEVYGCRSRIGIDIDGLALAEGHRRLGDGTGIVLVHAAAERLPLQDNGCTHLFCLNALNYMRVRAALAEFLRVLAPGGALVVRTAHIWYDLLMLSRAATGRLSNFSRPESARYAATVLRDLQAGVVMAATTLQPPRSRWLGKRVFLSTRTLKKLLETVGFDVTGHEPHPAVPVFLGHATQSTLTARKPRA
jgi:ubiquinone/menaquinone biosynthesis C-methylase UbiE